MGRTDEAERLLKQVLHPIPGAETMCCCWEIFTCGQETTPTHLMAGRAEANAARRACGVAAGALVSASEANGSGQPLSRAGQAPQPRTILTFSDPWRDTTGETGNYREAIAALKSIRDPKPDVMAELAYTYQLDGKLGESARLYTQAANAMPKDLGLQLSAARLMSLPVP